MDMTFCGHDLDLKAHPLSTSTQSSSTVDIMAPPSTSLPTPSDNAEPDDNAVGGADVESGIDRPTKRLKEDNIDEGEVAIVSSSNSSRVASPPLDQITNDAIDISANCQTAVLKLLFSPLPSSLAPSSTNANGTPSSNSYNATLRNTTTSAAEDNVSSFRQLWINHGFRTTAVTSPRAAVSVYLDSCRARCAVADEQGDG
jgi:hypothetical protein